MDRPTSSNPFVFVVGCPRSGTTLLQRILDHHPQLAVTNDSHFIPRAVRGIDADASTPLTPDLVDRVVEYRRFHRLGVDEATARAAASGAETYAGFVGALYDVVAGQAGKPLAGEKTPDYVRSLPLLHRVFPDARIVHIVRDGRDTALSLLDWATPTKGPGKLALWGSEPLAVAALWWAWQAGAGRRDGNAIGPDRYLEIRYEDLVLEPDRVMRAVSGFLDLDFTSEMLDYHVGRVKDSEGRSAKSAWLPPTPGLRDWRIKFSDDDLALFEVLVGDVLTSFGYELASQPPSRDTLRRADEIRRQWEIEPPR